MAVSKQELNSTIDKALTQHLDEATLTKIVGSLVKEAAAGDKQSILALSALRHMPW